MATYSNVLDKPLKQTLAMPLPRATPQETQTPAASPPYLPSRVDLLDIWEESERQLRV